LKIGERNSRRLGEFDRSLAGGFGEGKKRIKRRGNLL